MSERALPNPGTHSAKIVEGQSLVTYETDEGSLCVAIPCTLTDSDVQWQGKYTLTLVNRDGVPQTRNIQTAKDVFGWDGQLADQEGSFILDTLDVSEAEFELANCEHQDYTPPGETEPIKTFKPRWLNKKGGSTSMPEPLSTGDRKSIITKYAAKFRALSGGKKAAPPVTEVKGKTAPVKSGPLAKGGGPPGRKGNASSAQVRTMTQEEVWDAFVAANQDKDAGEELGPLYYAAQDKVAPDAGGDLTIQQWGAVADELGI